MKVTWTTLKGFVDDRSTPVQWIDLNNSYWIFAIDGVFTLETVIDKTTPASTDQTDFETNYKSDGNVSFSDSSGRPLSRFAITKSGWGLQCHSVSVETSKVDGWYNADKDGDDYGFIVMKFYDDTDTEITVKGTYDSLQLRLDAECVRTDVLWEPTYDFEMVAGEVWQDVHPTSTMRLWFFHEYSGHEFCTGGFNPDFLGADNKKRMDGRAPKLMPYNATYHTNRFILRARHEAGDNHKFMLVMEFYKE